MRTEGLKVNDLNCLILPSPGISCFISSEAGFTYGFPSLPSNLRADDVGVHGSGLNQPLRDLDGVYRGAFSDLVAGDEEVDASAVFAADVLADSSDENVVLVAGFERHRKMVFVAVVDDGYAGSFA